MNTRRRLCSFLVASGLTVLVASASLPLRTAEAADEPKNADTAPPLEIHSIPLKYAKASDTAGLLQKLFDTKPAEASIRLAVDESTNTLIIRAPGARIAEILEVIKKVDIPREDAEAPSPKLSIFPLRSLEPDKALEDSLRLAFGKSGNFAVDKTRKLVIVSADKNTMDAVEALITRLETVGASRLDEDVQVRVVWLVNATDQEKGSGPPDDLKEILPGLVKLGIDQPRFVAQFVVNAQPNAHFQAKGTAKLGTSPCNVSVSGRLNNRSDPAGLEITIQASRGTASGKEEICNLQTDITAPSGHLVVLGVTPTESLTSAFVVQVLRKEGQPKKQPPKK
jgi:hypothetical protein